MPSFWSTAPVLLLSLLLFLSFLRLLVSLSHPALRMDSDINVPNNFSLYLVITIMDVYRARLINVHLGRYTKSASPPLSEREKVDILVLVFQKMSSF